MSTYKAITPVVESAVMSALLVRFVHKESVWCRASKMKPTVVVVASIYRVTEPTVESVATLVLLVRFVRKENVKYLV